jgi:hypothetical protein
VLRRIEAPSSGGNADYRERKRLAVGTFEAAFSAIKGKIRTVFGE